jgi:hypothetical protein
LVIFAQLLHQTLTYDQGREIPFAQAVDKNTIMSVFLRPAQLVVKGQQRKHEWLGTHVLAQRQILVGLLPRASGRDCGRDQQSTAQWSGNTIVIVGLSKVALEYLATLNPCTLKARVLQFSFFYPPSIKIVF